MALSVQEVSDLVEKEKGTIQHIFAELSKVIVGQQDLLEKLLIGLLTDGHILVEGVPGLAKTTAIKALSDVLHLQFGRIQFTPDLLPADLVGTQIFSPEERSFTVKKGPLFANIILADEINRAPAKVQSALLEAMQEKQVTIGDKTFDLPRPFLVMATQNPVEQEGTYPLPEAQVDRFMLKVLISYPQKAEEIEIMKRMTLNSSSSMELEKVLTGDRIMELRNIVSQIFVDDKIYSYAADIVFATRNPESIGAKDLLSLIDFGASPRASIFLIKAAKAWAFIKGRAFVTPQDVKSVAIDVMRHRLTISYEAEAQDLRADDVLLKILDRVDVP